MGGLLVTFAIPRKAPQSTEEENTIMEDKNPNSPVSSLPILPPTEKENLNEKFQSSASADATNVHEPVEPEGEPCTPKNEFEFFTKDEPKIVSWKAQDASVADDMVRLDHCVEFSAKNNQILEKAFQEFLVDSDKKTVKYEENSRKFE